MRKNPQPHSFVDTQVKPGSIAEKVGLKVKDSLVKIGNDCALDYTIEEALESLKRGKDFFDMIVERWVFLQLFFRVLVTVIFNTVSTPIFCTIKICL